MVLNHIGGWNVLGALWLQFYCWYFFFKAIFSFQLLHVWCITSPAWCFIRGWNQNKWIWCWEYSHGITGARTFSRRHQSWRVCTTNVGESGIFHGLWLYSCLISLLLGLFSYLHKNPRDQLYLPHFSNSLLSFCHLQTSMSSTMWCIQGAPFGFLNRQRERDPFLLLLAPIQGFLFPFKWVVDEVSLIRLSQLTLVSAVCFPSKGVLTSPILFLYASLCTFHPGLDQKTPLNRGPNGLLYTPQFPDDIGYLEWVTRLL